MFGQLDAFVLVLCLKLTLVLYMSEPHLNAISGKITIALNLRGLETDRCKFPKQNQQYVESIQ